ncbi:MAG: CHAT domain-containing protein [Myxococcota bacterium]
MRAHRWVFSVALTACAAPPSADTARNLGPLRSAVDQVQRLQPGETLRFSLDPAPGKVLSLDVEQLGADVALAWLDEDQRPLALVDHRHTSLGHEILVASVSAPGATSLELRWAHPATVGGSFRVRRAELLSPGPALADEAAADALYRGADEAFFAQRQESLAVAEAGYLRALSAYQALGATGRAAEVERAACAVAHRLGHLKDALERCQAASEHARAAHDASLDVLARVDLAEIYGEIGDSARSRPLIEGALAATSTLGDSYVEGRAHAQRGLNHLESSEVPSGLLELDRAKALIEPLGDGTLLGEIYGNEAVLYSFLGDGNKAKAASLKAIEVAHRAGDRRMEGRATHGYGALVSDFDGDMKGALPHFRRASELLQSAGDQEGAARTLDAMGVMESSLGDPGAIAHHEAALSINRALGSRRFEAQTLTSLGAAYVRLDRPAEGIEPLTRAIALLHEVGAAEDEAFAWFRLGRGWDKLGEYPKAIDAAAHAVEIAEGLRQRLASDDARAFYSADTRLYYDSYVSSAMKAYHRSGDPKMLELAFRISEQARSRSLLDMLAMLKVDRLDARADALVRLDRLRAEFRALDAEKKRAQVLGAEPSKLAAIERQLLEHMGSYAEAQQSLARADPRAASLLDPTRVSLADAAKAVDPDTLLLEVHLGANGSYLWAVGSSTIAGYALGKEAPITSLSRTLHGYLAARNEQRAGESAEARAKRVERADAASATTAQALADLVLRPAQRAIAHKRRLIFAADGALHYVPFAMLPDPSASGQPLIAGHEVLSIPSASVLSLLQKRGRRSAPSGLALIADPVFGPDDPRIRRADTATVVASLDLVRGVDGQPLVRLPASRAEAESIAALVPRSSRRVLLDFDAKKSVVLSGALSDQRFVHFATHGLLDAAHPEASGLVLSEVDASGQAIDGLLRLVDIYGLHLSAELVTLSACETALGAEIRGEGLVGLTRGFFHAGARRVLASLWKVNDRATSLLMSELYLGLIRGGQTPAAALRAAMLKLRQDPRYAAPYYWAAFELQGD